MSAAIRRIGQAYAESDTGRKRRRNEDAFVCDPPLFAIADGMGGAQAGELASGLAASVLRESRTNDGQTRVVELIQEANRRVHQRATSDAAASGMGTTMTVALVEGDGTISFGHVGDSRAYLVREGRLEQLTDDHSLVAELVRRGELSPAEAEVHPQRSVITRALGTDPDVDVDSFSFDPQPNDLFLLCSDGLSSMVDATDLEQIVNRFRHDLREATRALIQAANRGGGEDNITAVLFEITDAPEVSGEPDERTREYAVAPDDDPDEEDTLHPEDRVRPPDWAVAGTAPPDDTMVVSGEELRASLAAHAEAATAAAPEALPEAGLGRRLLALTVIVVLVALIVLLVWRGLAS